MEPLHLSISIGALVVLGVMLALIAARHRLGALNAASWLVVLGAVVILPEHPQFAISLAEDPVISAHAHVHFVMAGVYAAIGLGLLCLIARTQLMEGRAAGWFAILAALAVGASAEIATGALWFQHGAPWYGVSSSAVLGFGWEWLDLYMVAWSAALLIAYRPIFAASPRMANRAHLRDA
jgi:hypothetical protein